MDVNAEKFICIFNCHGLLKQIFITSGARRITNTPSFRAGWAARNLICVSCRMIYMADIKSNIDETSSASNGHNGDLLKVYLAEYEFITDEILKRIESKQRLLVYNIFLIGIIITAGISAMQLDISDGSLMDRDPNKSFVYCMYFLLLIAPLPFYYLSGEYLNNISRIIGSTKYMKDLRAGIMRNIGDNNDENSDVYILKYAYFDSHTNDISNFLKDELGELSIKCGAIPGFIDRCSRRTLGTIWKSRDIVGSISRWCHIPPFTSFPLVLIGLFFYTYISTATIRAENLDTLTLPIEIPIVILLIMNFGFIISRMIRRDKIELEVKINVPQLSD